MSSGAAKVELGRGEKVVPGLWRLRLPLPWPGVPHVNAWAIRSADGIVLVDCGWHQAKQIDRPSSLSQLERAMVQVGLRLEQVHTLVISHAHTDHWGEAATVMERTGCELWMHPNHQHGAHGADPEAALAQLLKLGREAGLSEHTLAGYTQGGRAMGQGVVAAVVPDRELVNGVTVETDLGAWRVYETPGHAPSQVCLYLAERRLLISGDHLLGRTSLNIEYGWTDDPVGEYLDSLDVVAALDSRLCMSGHGRTFTNVPAHIDDTRALTADRLAAIAAELNSTPRTALELAPHITEDELAQPNTVWRLAQVLALLRHLESQGLAIREPHATGHRFRKP